MNNKNELNSSRQIKNGAIMAYITIAINMLAGLLYTPWIVRSLGQGTYGLYTLSTSLISMFVLDFGLSGAVTRFISGYNAVEDQKGVNNLLGIVSKLFVIIDSFICIILILVYFFIGIIYIQLTPKEIEQLKVIYIITASYSIISFPFTTLNGIMTSYEKFVSLKACDLINRILTIVLTISALSLGYGLYILVTINGVSGLVTILLKIRVIKKKTPIKINFNNKNKKMLQEILGFSIWSTIIAISQRFIFNLVPTILGVFSGSVSIAVFGIAATLEGYVYTFSTAINGMFLPRVSRMIARGKNNQDILSLMIKVGRMQFVIIGLLFVGFVSIGKEFIYLWMGQPFETSYFCALILMIPSLIELPQHIATITVVAVNKVKLQAYVYIGMAIINIILSILLSKYLGELGASISICIAYLFRTTAMNVLYYKILKINIFTFFKECYLSLGIGFLIPFFFGITIHIVVSVSSWLGFLLKAFFITITYISCMWAFALNQNEKRLFSNLFQRVLSVKKKSSHSEEPRN